MFNGLRLTFSVFVAGILNYRNLRINKTFKIIAASSQNFDCYLFY